MRRLIMTGFTLIELLVVVAIIALLLALLMPALDRAIYQAQLAVCGANLKGIANAMPMYAMDNKRSYMYRAGMNDGDGTGWQLCGLTTGRGAVQAFAVTTNPMAGDLRPQMGSYLPVNKAFNDTFVKPVELERDTNAANTTGGAAQSFVLGSYQLFAGWHYNDKDHGGPGMLKLGDRFEWKDRNFVSNRFSVIVSDIDHFNMPGSQMCSHPDEQGVLANTISQDQELASGKGAGGDGAVASGLAVTYSWWSVVNGPVPVRGKIDTNAGFNDGSVERYGGVTAASSATGDATDERMASVAWGPTVKDAFGKWPTVGAQIPKK